MKRTSLLFAIGAIVFLGACKGETVSGIGGGGSGGSGASGGSGGSGCFGDAAKWQAITQGPFTCQKNSDCCVVTNGCLAEVQIVKAADYTSAQTAWPYCNDTCTLCEAPPINIACVNGTCVGEEVDFETHPELAANHCGEDQVTVGTPASGTNFGCGN